MSQTMENISGDILWEMFFEKWIVKNDLQIHGVLMVKPLAIFIFFIENHHDQKQKKPNKCSTFNIV